MVEWSPRPTGAQDHEDEIVLDYLSRNGGPRHRVLVDVGAYSKELSNSLSLLQSGWRGILLEADTDKSERLKKDFEGMDVEIIMQAVGDKDCIADFYVNIHPGGHSFMWGFNANQDKERVRKIRMRPLADILDEHDVPFDFDFLQVDTEGFDQKIILTLLDDKRYRPRVICMEFGMEDPIPMLAERGYELLKQTITTGRYSNVIFVDNGI